MNSKTNHFTQNDLNMELTRCHPKYGIKIVFYTFYNLHIF